MSEAKSETKPIVQVRNLHKSFGDLNVLCGIDLDIAPAEHVAIIGPSGSGKSTLLRVMMTLEEPTEGYVYIDGDELYHVPGKDGKMVRASAKHTSQVRGKVGMVFQHFNLFPHLRVLRNVTEAPRRVLGMSRADANKQAVELLDMVGLADKADAWPGELSGGQKQRVAIARALAMQPKVMLFDEVTSALDPELVGEVLNVLRKLAVETSMTMLLVTHQMDFAAEIAHRVLFFDGGKLIEDAPPERIFNDPQHPRTQQFLATINEGVGKHRPAGNASER